MKHTMTKLARGAALFALLCALLCGTASAANPFTDVERGDQYYNAVMWALNNGVTAGTTAETFSPDSTCNRGQVVTFLWRAAGEPEPAAQTNPFADVTPGSYCYKAVLWAVQKGITNGTSATAFSPANPCTYAHVLAFLWRSVGSPAPAGRSWYAGQYANQWYTNALAWAETSGVLGEFGVEPGTPCPRAAIVSFLYRWAAPGSVLSLYPELQADREEIPRSELNGIYSHGNVTFIVEEQWDGESESGPELLFYASDNITEEILAGMERVSANIYQSTYDDGEKITVGFSRRNGTVYLDYYRNDTHMGMVPPEDSGIEMTYTLSDYLGRYVEAEAFYPVVDIEPLGGKRCRISMSMKYSLLEADGEFDDETQAIFYTDGKYSERDKGEDFAVVDSGYAGAVYFESPGLLRLYDAEGGVSEERFVRYSHPDD